jgi:Fe-S oxidoreductase/nitrate reductase gamma subunit
LVERKFMPFMPASTSLIMYAVFFLALAIFLYGVRYQLAHIGIGFKEFLISVYKQVTKNSKPTVIEIVNQLFMQKKTQETASGKLLHSPIFYASLVLLAGTAIVAVDEDILSKIGDFKLLSGSFYLSFELVLDTAGLLFILGLAVALFRRLVFKPAYIHTKAADYWVLCLLLIIIISGFIIEALRLQLDKVPYAKYSFVGNFLKAHLFRDIETTSGLITYRIFWFFHFIAAMSAIALIPFTKLKHLLLIPFNYIICPPKPYGQKAKVNTPYNILEIDEEDDASKEKLKHVGVGSVKDLNWKECLQIYSCINCGRCEEVCPACKAGRLLSPRNVIQKIGDQIAYEDKAKDLFEKVILQEEMWGCTNCYACIEVCPAFIQHVDHFINFRRFIVNNAFEDEAKISVLEGIDRNGNPYGLPSYERAEWLSEHQVSTILEKDEDEYLYFIGCSSSYDQRCRKITEAVINILNFAEVDFAILGEEERCCGEPAKRMGEEGLYQLTAVQNIELFESFSTRKIIVHCPHCYNMFKYEYKDFGGAYDVIHHSELISNLIKKGKIKFKQEKPLHKITFHDPCNLGRLNGIYDQPRKSLASLGEIIEMNHCKEKALCCGGGAGNAFYKVETEEKRISQIRIEEALKTEASKLGLACPFCMIMFEDAKGLIANKQSPALYDIAEIVSASMKSEEKVNNIPKTLE